MKEDFSFLNTLITYGAIQGLFIAIVLTKSKPKSLFKFLFAILLSIESIILFERLIVETRLINDIPHVLGVGYTLSFLKPPLMLFMAWSLTERSFTIGRNKFLHFIPFFLILLMNIPVYMKTGAEKVKLVNNYMEKVPSYSSFEFYFTLSFFFYIGIYILLAIRKMNVFRKHTINNVQVNWYRKLLVLYTAFLALELGYFLIQPLGELNLAFINQGSMLAMTFIIQAIAYVLIDRSSIASHVRLPDKVNLDQRKVDLEKILSQIENEKIYLDDELTLKKFSLQISLPEKYVSQLINGHFNYSFKRLINRYRVAEVKRLLSESVGERIKLIEVGYRSGFNNKVTFYRTFKEFENLSPSEYLEEKTLK